MLFGSIAFCRMSQKRENLFPENSNVHFGHIRTNRGAQWCIFGAKWCFFGDFAAWRFWQHATFEMRRDHIWSHVIGAEKVPQIT